MQVLVIFPYLCDIKMKTWSKYIILIITIFAIFLCKGESISSKENHIALIEQLADETEFISTDLSDLPYSQSTTFKNTHQSQKNSLRRDNIQRQASSFFKKNKTINLNISIYTIKKSTHKSSIFSESSYRLIKLGKLLI